MIYHPIESEMEMFARVYSRDTGVKIVFGQGFGTDGKIITIVRLLDHADPWVRFEIEMGVYHETGHVISKDFPAFHSYTNKTKKVLFNVVRDVTIEGHIMEIRYPGMKPKWKTFLTWIINRNNADIAAGNVKPFQMLTWAMYFRAREYQHGEEFGKGIILPPAIEEIYDRRILPFIPEIAAHEGIPASQDLTERIFEELMKEPPPPKPTPQPAAQSGGDEQQQSGEKSEEEDEGGGGLDGTPDEWEEKKEEKETTSSDKSDDEPEEGSEDNDSEDNDSEDNDSEDNDSEDKDEPSEDTSNEENSKDEDDSEEGSDGSGNSEKEDDEDKSADESDGSGDSEKDKDENESKDESGGSGDNEEEDSEDEDEDPFSDEGEEALKEAQEDMEEGAEDTTTVGDDIAEDVNEYANTTHLYREISGLEERIIRCNPRYNWAIEVAEYEAKGKKMTGYAGTKLKILFISEQAPVTHRNLKDGKLDCLNLWKTKTGSTEVCKRKIPPSLEDSAVSMVVDNSGSMDGEKGSITHSLLTSLSSDLDKLRIPFEAIGFTTPWVHNNPSADQLANTGIRSLPINIHLMKAFTEQYRSVRHRFVWPAQTIATAELPAIIFAARRLVERRETKKVLFLLTDGGTCTGNENLDASMHEATKDFIERMKRAGIKVVIIGIQSVCVLDYDLNALVLDDLNIFASQFYGNLTKLLL